MTPPAQPIDIVTVVIAILSAVLGREMSAVVGPYAVILLCALGGASWSAAKRDKDGRVPTLMHIAWMVGLALIGTVPIAEAMARFFDLQARWMFAPIAVVIAARPDWVIGQVRRLIERRAGTAVQEDKK